MSWSTVDLLDRLLILLHLEAFGGAAVDAVEDGVCGSPFTGFDRAEVGVVDLAPVLLDELGGPIEGVHLARGGAFERESDGTNRGGGSA